MEKHKDGEFFIVMDYLSNANVKSCLVLDVGFESALFDVSMKPSMNLYRICVFKVV